MLPKKMRKEISLLDEDSTMMFIDAVKGHRYEIILLVTVFTELRKNESCGLTRDCIDFKTGSILANKQFQRAIKSKRGVEGLTTMFYHCHPKAISGG